MIIRLRYEAIDLWLLLFTFYEITYMPHIIFITLRSAILLYLFLKYFPHRRMIHPVNTGIVIYTGAVFISTLINRMTINYVFSCLSYAAMVADIFLVVSCVVYRIGLTETVKYAVRCLLFMLLVNDLLLLLIHYNFDDPSETYFMGSKFTVSYLHCFVSAALFYSGIYNKRKRYFVFAFIFSFYSVLITAAVNCTTGIITELLLIAMMLLPQLIKAGLQNMVFLVAFTLILNVLIFGSFSLFTNPGVSALIYGLLGKSYTFTGRLKIYSVLFDLLRKKFWIGYGYNNSAVSNLVGFGNAQNGIFKILTDTGASGLFGYGIIVYSSLKNQKIAEEWPFWAFVYVMFAAGLVEISMTHPILFFAFSLLFASKYDCIVQTNNQNTEHGYALRIAYE